MNPYELILIFDPAFGEERIGLLLAKIEDKLKGFGGQIDKVEKWGTRRLASMMKNAKTATQGYYVLVRLSGPPNVPADIKAFLKVTENILRYFVSRAVILEAPPERKGPPGMAQASTAVEVGEIKGEPLGQP